MTREHAIKLRELLHKASASLTDEDALEGIELFALWQTGVWYEMDSRIRYDGRLYKVRIAHTSQTGWEPPNAPALFAEVEKPGQGDTPDNPIPYNNNMELFNGKYYSQSGVVYHCFRDTGTPVYNNLADLVGLYVEVAK